MDLDAVTDADLLQTILVSARLAGVRQTLAHLQDGLQAQQAGLDAASLDLAHLVARIAAAESMGQDPPQDVQI